VTARVGRMLPRGWWDFAFQLGLWLGFGLVYQVARGLADRDPFEAFENGRLVIDAERAVHTLVEIDVQRVILEGGALAVDVVNYTYWLAQFPLLGLALLWIYLRRHESFIAVRNWILATNLVALVGYVLMPTAPPRMFPEWGFVDWVAQYSAVSHESSLIAWGSNPYAAMPSLHAMDAFIVGVVMFGLVRSRAVKALWLAWPAWVAFSVIATANHYWLDVAAGVILAIVAGVALSRVRIVRLRRA
jgi:membrane-associated phospholipid phosphatase